MAWIGLFWMKIFHMQVHRESFLTICLIKSDNYAMHDELDIFFFSEN